MLVSDRRESVSHTFNVLGADRNPSRVSRGEKGCDSEAWKLRMDSTQFMAQWYSVLAVVVVEHHHARRAFVVSEAIGQQNDSCLDNNSSPDILFSFVEV